MPPVFLTLLQRRLGSTSIGPSTARGMEPAGTIQSARAFLATLSLDKFVVSSEPDFRDELDRVTEALRLAMPKEAQYWGSARKFLNIFLRGCTYNRHICDHYDLARTERWLEIPLDSHVADGLRTQDSRTDLPRWKTVIGLTPKLSDTYQHAAAEVARTHGVYRVHLDMRYWRARNA